MLIMVHLIKKILSVEPYRICVLFNTGESRVVNLSEKLKEWANSETSKYRELLEPGYFETVRLNKELETIYWENGIDFCPDSLYAWSEPANSTANKIVTQTEHS